MAADVGDVLAHGLEQGRNARETGFGRAGHDGQRAGLGADFAARNRRIHVFATQRADALGETLGVHGRDRAHVDHHLAGRQALGHALLAEQHAFDIGRIGQHEDDHVGLLGHGTGAACGRGAGLQQRFRHRAAALDEKAVAGFDEAAAHGRAHDAQADESNLHAATPGAPSGARICLSKSWEPAASRRASDETVTKRKPAATRARADSGVPLCMPATRPWAVARSSTWAMAWATGGSTSSKVGRQPSDSDRSLGPM
ncbi:hypothetical protein D3C78_1274950 [compost metagenome]